MYFTDSEFFRKRTRLIVRADFFKNQALISDF